MYAGKRDFNVEAEPEPLLQRGTKGFTKKNGDEMIEPLNPQKNTL